MNSAVFASILAFAASSALAQYDAQSPPFYLQLLSDNSTLNGSYLASCHTGAAIESLCLYGSTDDSDHETYNLNTTDPYVANATGYLTWVLPGGNFNESEPLTFDYDATSNVAMPVFEPSETGQGIAFDCEDNAYISSYLNYSTSPPSYYEDAGDNGQPFYNWWFCHTNFAGYTYETLVWSTSGNPVIPDCSAVSLHREFV